jgi:two-component system chemotaxis response regulator CheY
MNYPGECETGTSVVNGEPRVKETNRMRALVIDDSRAMRAILGKILKELGFEVAEAGHGREGLERLGQSEIPDLVLVDWNMPEMDGLEFVRTVRANRAYDAMQLMMVTTEAEVSAMVCALEAGANEYVMKPFTKDVIVEKLAMLGIES